MRRTVVLTALTGLLLAPALAVAAGPYSWTGAYVGAAAGVNKTDLDNFSSENTLTLGIDGGYNYQVSEHFVAGGDVFYNYNKQTDHTFSLGGTSHFGSNVYGVDGLVGFPVGMTGAFMPYAKLGYGHLEATGDASGSDNALRIGAGLAWKVSMPVSVSIQYMHAKYGSSSDNWKNDNLTLGVSYHFY